MLLKRLSLLRFNNMETYEELKEKANDYYRKQEYDKAVDLYTQAIEKAISVDGDNNRPASNTLATYYGNRSIGKMNA